MQSSTRRAVQAFLAIALVVSAARVAWIFIQRREPVKAPPRRDVLPGKQQHPDFFVYLPRFHLTTFESAKSLTGKPLWVRDGWRYQHIPFDARSRRAREAADAPLLAPIRRIVPSDIVSQPAGREGRHLVYVVFEEPQANPPARAVPIGHCDNRGDNCTWFVEDMFFQKDPRVLYTHWPPEVWQSIERGEAKTGMSETQVTFALGFGRMLRKETSESGGGRVLEFHPPGRQPVVVTFGRDGNAGSVENAVAQQR